MKIIHNAIFVASLLLSVTLSAHFCGLEEGIRKHVNAILSTVKNDYKKDPIIQAIFKRDAKAITNRSFNPRKHLEVKVPWDKNSYAVCKLNYIGLAFGSAALKPETLETKQFYNLVKALIDKNVNPQGKYSWELFVNKKGTLRKINDAHGLNSDLALRSARNNKKLEALAQLFKR